VRALSASTYQCIKWPLSFAFFGEPRIKATTEADGEYKSRGGGHRKLQGSSRKCFGGPKQLLTDNVNTRSADKRRLKSYLQGEEVSYRLAIKAKVSLAIQKWLGEHQTRVLENRQLPGLRYIIASFETLIGLCLTTANLCE
jgi:hypothetical protein